MTSLEELRTQLSDVDDQITDLYEKRMKICEDLGTCKIKNGYKTFDRQREKNKIAEVMGKVSSDFNKKGIGEVYELLLAISRKLQYKQLVEAGALGRLPFIGIDSLDKDTARVVFQGTEGAYSQAAMEHYFGKGCNSYHVHTFREAMEAIEEGAADYAVLPIENSTAGAVNEIYDLLVEFENYIVGETIIPIKNTLSGLPGTDISEIERVYSKAEALMQASHFLGEHGDWQQISVANTALAAKKILEDQDKHQAAVCSAYAASVYGLSVLADSINDEKNNSTRFIVIKTRRSIRKFKPDPVDHATLESLIGAASYSPSWKNTQITRYIAIEDSSILDKIVTDYTPDFNAKIIKQAPMLIAVTFKKGRCGFERDCSYSTKKEDRWQMFDVGVASQTLCLAAHEAGLGTVIMGIWDEDGITDLLHIPEDQELAALIAIGYPDIDPDAPKRKSVDDLLTYL